MKKLYLRLIVSLSALILLVMFALSFLLGQIVQTYFIENFEETLVKEGEAISSHIKEAGGWKAMTENKVRKMNQTLQTDVVLIFKTGEIIFGQESKINKLSMEERNELLKGAVMPDQLRSLKKTTKLLPHTYQYSVPYVDGGPPEGYIVLYADGEKLDEMNSKLAWLLVISFTIAFFIIILYGSNIMWRMTRSINDATRVIDELAKGNYRLRLDPFEKETITPLNKSVNMLADNLEDSVKKQEMQRDRLSALVENMGSGLILIDGQGYISIVNRTYKEMFQIADDSYENKLYSDVILMEEVNDLVDSVFMTEQKVRRQIILPINIERRHFEVYGAPIIGENSTWEGISVVFHDITELKKLEQTRKDFVANVSHEIKTPITSIKGFSETLLDGAMKDEEALQSFLEIILKESNRLEALVHDLLELSRIEQEGFKLNRQKVNMYELLEEVFALLIKRAEENEINLQFTCTSKEVNVFADYDRMKQVFINLINNAISYTHKNGAVTIHLQATKKAAIIEVSDTGIGIEPKEVPRIFERFYRIDKARSRNSGGTGLGLAIVKHIVEAHQGKILVESNVGEGTTFTLEIPKRM